MINHLQIKNDNMNIERRQSQYRKARKRVEKLYPGCKLSARERGGFLSRTRKGEIL